MSDTVLNGYGLEALGLDALEHRQPTDAELAVAVQMADDDAKTEAQ